MKKRIAHKLKKYLMQKGKKGIYYYIIYEYEKKILLLYPKRTVIKIKCCVRLPRYELDGEIMEI